MLNTRFSSESGILARVRQRCLCEQPPLKTWGSESLVGFLGQKHCTEILLPFHLGRVHCVSPYGRERTWIPSDSCCVFSPFYPGAYCSCITVIKPSSEYKLMLSPVSLSSKSPNIRVVFGNAPYRKSSFFFSYSKCNMGSHCGCQIKHVREGICFPGC